MTAMEEQLVTSKLSQSQDHYQIALLLILAHFSIQGSQFKQATGDISGCEKVCHWL